MIASYLLLIGASLGWFAVLTVALFAVGRRLEFLARPPAVDCVVILYTAAPWIAGGFAGAQIHQHWLGGVGGVAAVTVAQILALEIFDWVHCRIAARQGIQDLQINRSIERRFGKLKNRTCLWLTVPSIPFFLYNRLGFLGYFLFEWMLGFSHFKSSDYITVSRQKIQNLVGADLVWCLYCDWMTGGWTLTSEILNEVESFWCPLKFSDATKCAKCANYFSIGHWTPPQTTAAEIGKIAGLAGKDRLIRSPCACPTSETASGSGQPQSQTQREVQSVGK